MAARPRRAKARPRQGTLRDDLAVKYRERDQAFRDQWTATREAGGNSDMLEQLLDGLGNRRRAEALEDGEAVEFWGWEIQKDLPASAGLKLNDRYTLTEDNRLIFGERS